MQLLGANPAAPAAGVDPLVTKVNYFLGNDPAKWHTNIPTFGKVQYDDVYPGIDLVYYGTQGSGVRGQESGIRNQSDTQHSALSTTEALSTWSMTLSCRPAPTRRPSR
jgi:hypothetical protein